MGYTVEVVVLKACNYLSLNYIFQRKMKRCLRTIQKSISEEISRDQVTQEQQKYIPFNLATCHYLEDGYNVNYYPWLHSFKSESAFFSLCKSHYM